MREIIFKGKRKDNGEWIEGSLITSINRAWISSEKTDSQRLRSISNTNAIWRSIEIIPDTICQFTGLCDKNGKKIWENDIIQYGAFAAVVKFGEYGNGNLGFYVDFPEETNYRKDFSYWAKKVVVIGNAVDDRSLLQEVLE